MFPAACQFNLRHSAKIGSLSGRTVKSRPEIVNATKAAMNENVGLNHVHDLLSRVGIPVNTPAISVVTIIGSKDTAGRLEIAQSTFIDAANSIVGDPVFSSSSEAVATKLSMDLQVYYSKSKATTYFLLDTVVDYQKLAEFAKIIGDDHQDFQNLLTKYDGQLSRTMLLLFWVSHLVVPILPSQMLNTELATTLTTLLHAKQSINTHMTQLLTACWRKWDIPVPGALAERKDGKREKERDPPKPSSWWGPGKSVPSLVVVGQNVIVLGADRSVAAHLPTAVKKVQDSTTSKLKYLLRAMHLLSSSADGGSSVTPGNENRTLFTVPAASTQSFVFIIPSSDNLESHTNDVSTNPFQPPPSLESFIESFNSSFDGKQSKATQEESLLSDYNGKLLRNFVSNALKTAVHAAGRPATHINAAVSSGSKRPYKTELPSAVQVFSALVIGMNTLLEKVHDEEIRRSMVTDSPGAKGIIQQIEAALRKRIDLVLDVDNVYSKSQCTESMQRSLDAYTKDLPPYYTEQYHFLKRDIALNMYEITAQGPCFADYRQRLLQECDEFWQQGRQKCELKSLTGRECCLKRGHELDSPSQQSNMADEQNEKAGTSKQMLKSHNSGYRPLHACNCGQCQKIREDPFTLVDANVNFYRSFKCCTAEMKQNMNLSTQEQQSSQMSLTKLGSAKVYRHHVGLDNCEGFTAAAKFLLPWDIPLKNEPTDPNLPKPQNTTTSPDITSTDKNDSIQPIDETNWPALGQAPKVSPTPAMMVPSYEMFPALGASRQSEASERADVKPKVDTSAASAPAPETKRDGRRRRRGDKSSHSNKAIHCHLHLEYECPLGHRFMSCGDGKVCKHGHMKQESAKRFLNQDSPIYILCPCNYIGDQRNSKPSITAQLQRIWIVAPDAPGSLKLNIVCKFQDVQTGGVQSFVAFPESQNISMNGMYVLRLPYIYTDSSTSELIPISLDAEVRTRSAKLERNFISYAEPS